MPTKVRDHKDYFVWDADQIREPIETMNALNDLMMKVAATPGIDIYMTEQFNPPGFKITIVKG